MSSPKTPDILDRIVDKVLAYRPKPKTKGAKKRKKLAKNLAAAKAQGALHKGTSL